MYLTDYPFISSFWQAKMKEPDHNEIVHAIFGQKERLELITIYPIERREWTTEEIIRLLDDGMKYRLLQEAKKISEA